MSERIIILKMDLTDKQIPEIIPSGTVWINIVSVQGEVHGEGEIVELKNSDGN